MAKFSLEIEFDSQPHSAGADRAFVGRALDQARQAIMSGAKTEGVLRVPKVGVPDPVVIGRWKIQL
jgi:hypothetical protein